jgi:hypothetical protein
MVRLVARKGVGMSKWKLISAKLVPVISACGLAAIAAVLSATGKWG